MNKPTPYATPESELFWSECRRGKLMYQHCSHCGHRQFYPRIHCTVCGSKQLAWKESSGMGTIFTYTVIHRAPSPAYHTPYVLALVELDEGYRMMANILDAEPEEVSIGDRVAVDFEQRGDMHIPQFRLYLLFDKLRTGKVYGEGVFECGKELVDQWNDIYPEFSVDSGDSNKKNTVPPGMVGAIIMNTYDVALKGRPKGNVHGSQVFDVYRPISVGDTLRTKLSIEDKFLKNEKKWVIIRTQTTSSDGDLVLDGKMQVLWAE